MKRDDVFKGSTLSVGNAAPLMVMMIITWCGVDDTWEGTAQIRGTAEGAQAAKAQSMFCGTLVLGDVDTIHFFNKC